MWNTKSIFGSLNSPYYIASPPFREDSGGVRALHYLCHALNISGEEAYVTTDVVATDLRTPYLSQQIREQHQKLGIQPIVVYPEVVQDNPLGAINVVRYLLNVPGRLTKQEPLWSENDLIFTHSAHLTPVGKIGHLLEVPLVDTRVYNSDGVNDQSRSGTLVFIHRYIDRGGELQPITANSLEISYRVKKRSPEELAALYRGAQLMYTYEPSTACYEAVLCGCPVVYLPNELTLDCYFDGPVGTDGFAWGAQPTLIEQAKKTVHLAAENYRQKEAQFWEQLRAFIEITQERASANRSASINQKSNLEEGIAHYRCGNYLEALNSLVEHSQAHPDEPETYFYLALIGAAKNQPSESELFIRQAVNLSTKGSVYLACLGEAFLAANNPEEAVKYLKEAAKQSPEMFSVYPALAKALGLQGRHDEAIQLLRAVAISPLPNQAETLSTLLRLQSEQGNLVGLLETSQRISNDPAYESLAIRLLTRTNCSEEDIRERYTSFLKSHLPPPVALRPVSGHKATFTIAFIVSDLYRESLSGRLEALLLHLPHERFKTVVIDNDPLSSSSETAQRCYLLAEHYISASDIDDNGLNEALIKLDIDILFDLDGIGPRHRLGLLCSAVASFKASWSDIPTWELPGIALFIGENLLSSRKKRTSDCYTVTLDGLGETISLPSVNLATQPNRKFTRFGSLTAANKISADCWRIFAKLLTRVPASTLTINLGDLGAAGEEFVRQIFRRAGIDATRLEFMHACTLESLCAACNSIDVGLAAPYGNADMALPCYLWMNTPYVAFESENPWSRRPAAWLEQVQLSSLIAIDEEEYINIACTLSQERPSYSLRERLATSHLSDQLFFAQDFARAVLGAYNEKTQ